MIQAHPEAGLQPAGAIHAPVRRVSFQGSRLTDSDRRRLAQQQQCKPFMNPVLQQQVDEALAAVEKLKSEPYDDPYRYRMDHQSKGTPWLGDVFGF